MKKYKLTRQDLTTHNGCQWTVGEWKETSGNGELCSNGWLHCYDTPEIASFMNPIHADYNDPLLWEVEVEGKELREGQLKSGWTRMRLIKQSEMPVFTVDERVKIGILGAMEVYKETSFVRWADNWIDGTDRTEESAWAAWAAAERAAWSAAWGAAWSAAWAADRAASAEMSAAWATDRAAWNVERAAAWAAECAAAWGDKDKELKLTKIIERVKNEKI